MYSICKYIPTLTYVVYDLLFNNRKLEINYLHDTTNVKHCYQPSVQYYTVYYIL